MGGLNGQLLAGRYQLVEKIGQGGMGAVWRAFDTGLDREVAVKELRLPEWIDEDERSRRYDRMGREARAAARLKHPGIVTVYDRVADEDGRPWIVMELVHGTSVADELKRHGRLPVERVAAIGLRLLEAVSAAHAHGIVHRDIKPANVLLEGDRVVLTDFGIAALDGDVTLTSSGAILGTPAYMSPEQIDGSSAPESDLWSLGATLYAAVEGHPPFTGRTDGAVFAAVATQDPIPPAHAGPLSPVLSGLLRKTPAERLTTGDARELLTPLAGSRAPEQESRVPSHQTFVGRNSVAGPNTAALKAKPQAYVVPIILVWIAVVVVALGLIYRQSYSRPAWDGVVSANTCIYRATQDYSIVSIREGHWYREPCSRPWGPGTAFTVHGTASGGAYRANQICGSLATYFSDWRYVIFPGRGSGVQPLIMCIVPLH